MEEAAKKVRQGREQALDSAAATMTVAAHTVSLERGTRGNNYETPATEQPGAREQEASAKTAGPNTPDGVIAAKKGGERLGVPLKQGRTAIASEDLATEDPKRTWRSVKKGDRVSYAAASGAAVEATVVQIDGIGEEAYYTIMFAGRQERQTVRERLRHYERTDSSAAPEQTISPVRGREHLQASAQTAPGSESAKSKRKRGEAAATPTTERLPARARPAARKQDAAAKTAGSTALDSATSAKQGGKGLVAPTEQGRTALASEAPSLAEPKRAARTVKKGDRILYAASSGAAVEATIVQVDGTGKEAYYTIALGGGQERQTVRERLSLCEQPARSSPPEQNSSAVRERAASLTSAQAAQASESAKSKEKGGEAAATPTTEQLAGKKVHWFNSDRTAQTRPHRHGRGDNEPTGSPVEATYQYTSQATATSWYDLESSPPEEAPWVEGEEEACPLEIKKQLDAEERLGLPVGPLKSNRGAPPLDAVGKELLPYMSGVTRFPPWEGGVQPRLRVSIPRTHDAAARRNARRQEQHELRFGDRTSPKLAYELVDPREGIASSTSVEEIMRAAPGYGEELDDLRARFELPVANCDLSRAMCNFYLIDHLASKCVQCCAPAQPDEERIAGFHCDCWALRFYMNGTRGCRLEVGDSPPPPVVERNYESLQEYPRSTARGFMKHYRAGAFGPPLSAGKRALRHKHGPPFAARTYRRTMPKSVASSVFPQRCAPLGAVVRHADRLKAELLGVDPKARIIYDLTKVGTNAATFGGRRWRFRYAGLEALMPFLRRGGYCASFDLAAFYCQIPVDEQTARYFVAEVPPLSEEERAEIGLVGPGPHFVRYRSLPMGWNASCAHASAFSAAICEEAMRRGANVAVSYIDDIVIAGDTAADCRRSQEIVRQVIEERFGLRINPSKTELPQQLLEWIGITIDTENEQFCISAERSARMVVEIRSILNDPRPTVGKVRSCLGRLSWLSMIMRGARAYSSPLFGAIKSRTRSDRVVLAPRDRLDLEWFIQQLEGKDWRGSLWLTPATQVSYAKSDAGEDAVFLVSEGRFLYHRLTAEEKILSSHARELLPAVLAAQVFGPEWRGRYVAFAFDNSGTAFSVSSGSSRDAGARDMLRMVADATVAYDFAMIGLWTQRAANVLNDAGSKVRVDEWSTAPVRIDYAADEMAASVLDVGQGCWLFPRFHDPVRDVVLGYIQGDRHWC